jgi:endonuclease/exonuclease/phosphatase (EEP) superfamily protein YafD
VVRVRWSNLVLLSALPACPVAVAPFAASLHWSIDLLACFPVQAMGWLVITALVLAAMQRWRPAGLLAAFAAVAAAAVVPDWLHEPPRGDPTGQAVRVLSLNLMRGNEANVDTALAVVRTIDPDVLVCSELTPAWLTALTPGLVHLPHRCLHTDKGYFGIAVFSRWPLANAAVLPLGSDWAPAVRAVVAAPGKSFGVLAIHTPRPGDGDRCAERDRALAAIPQALQPLPATRLVVGDHNATPWNHAFRTLLAATGLLPAAAGAWLPTWTTHWPWPLRIPIDHLLASADIGVAECGVGATFGSDHAPLFATLRLPR